MCISQYHRPHFNHLWTTFFSLPRCPLVHSVLNSPSEPGRPTPHPGLCKHCVFFPLWLEQTSGSGSYLACHAGRLGTLPHLSPLWAEEPLSLDKSAVCTSVLLEREPRQCQPLVLVSHQEHISLQFNGNRTNTALQHFRFDWLASFQHQIPTNLIVCASPPRAVFLKK